MTQQFREEVARYTDRGLAQVLRNGSGYTEEARHVFEEEADRRGGITAVLERADAALEREKFLRTLTKWIDQQLRVGKSTDAIRSGLESRGAVGADVEELIEECRGVYEREIYENTNDSDTVIGTISGALVAGVLGGVYTNFLIMGRERFFFIFGFGLIALCYGIVRAFSRGKKTTVVYVATMGAILLSGAIGTFLYSHGYLLGR